MTTPNAMKSALILAAALLLGACATSQSPAHQQQRGSFIDRQGNRVVLDKKRPAASASVVEGAGGVYECRNGQCQPLAPVQIQ
ncbi:hypothetical protein CLI92_10295 [Vandammella animalimorsus]|uniref:Lipoprotein n=2 Tax=Vandammella animalimorsus TaxID=2029117 RepID=A0A2A2T3V2_9BURK|nr:hypothetical protein CK626_09000 [Vandammella animalimorsus]PAX16189.1 hypothetical protein CLI92_10295 [Vandammella animalimorsus]PAX18218.1 hypothetical protein CLI93_11825 [Vandammella animalimorsus]